MSKINKAIDLKEYALDTFLDIEEAFDKANFSITKTIKMNINPAHSKPPRLLYHSVPMLSVSCNHYRQRQARAQLAKSRQNWSNIVH